jgi:hypothetical protein
MQKREIYCYDSVGNILASFILNLKRRDIKPTKSALQYFSLLAIFINV